MVTKLARDEVPPELVASAMKVCFGENTSGTRYHFDSLYLGYAYDSEPLGFTFIKEVNKNEVFLTYGGMVPDARGFATLKNYRLMLGDLCENYKFITTQVCNENLPMLKIHLAHGFKIVGTTKRPDGRVFVDLLKTVGEK